MKTLSVSHLPLNSHNNYEDNIAIVSDAIPSLNDVLKIPIHPISQF